MDDDTESDDSAGAREGGAGLQQLLEGVSPDHGGPFGASGCAQGVSAEEFARLQDELLALKMYNQELQQERRRLVGRQPPQSPPQQQYPGSAPMGAGASAFQRSMASNFQAGSAAISAFGMRAQASFQSAAATMAATGNVQQGFVLSGPVDGLDEHDREALRAEAQYLRSRIKATLEEAEEFRTVATDAQQVVDAAERASRAAKKVPVEVPLAADVRRHVLQASSGAAHFDTLGSVSDEVLLRITRAALELAHGPLDAGGAHDVHHDGAGAGGANEGDEEKRLLRSKVEQQQQELKRLLEIFHKQQEQIAKLISRVSNNEDEASRELRRATKKRLKDAEGQVEAYMRQMEASEQASQSSQELRMRLRGLASEASQRDVLLAEMRSMLEAQEFVVAGLRERLHSCLEDVAARISRRAEASAQAQALASPRRRAQLLSLDGASLAASQGASPSSRGQQVAAFAGYPGPAASSAASPGSRAAAAATTSGSAAADVEVQAAFDEDAALSSILERRSLQAQLEDLRVAKAVLEKRTARELRDLRSLVPKSQAPPQRAVSSRAAPTGSAEAAASPAGPAPLDASAAALDSSTPADTPPQTASPTEHVPPAHAVPRGDGGGRGRGGAQSSAATCIVMDISSDGEEERGGRSQRLRDKDASAEESVDARASHGGASPPEYSEEMLYVQRVEELEDRTAVLRQELGAMHEAERALKAQCKERNELIAHLLERVDAQKGPAFGAAAAVGRSVYVPASASGAGADKRGHPGSAGATTPRPARSREEDLRELESIVDDVTEDNIRLRNDIQIMSEEFRRVLAAVTPPPVKGSTA